MSKNRFTKLFTWANIFKLGLFYVICLLTYNLLILVFSSNFFQLFTVKEIGSADFTFNDLYYRVAEKGNFKHKNFRNPKSVVLINTGSLEPKTFRAQLVRLLYELENYEPSVISLDHIFNNDSTKVGTIEFVEAASYFGNLIVAYDSSATDNLKLEMKPADVYFPMQTSLRYYKCSDQSFAYLIAKGLNKNLKPFKNPKDSFPINFCSYDNGFVDWQDDMNALYEINFKAIEASDFFTEMDSLSKAKLYNLIKGKALILGHLGAPTMRNKNDIEDKFRVPVDPKSMTARDKIMPGMVIHANAAENYLHPEERFFEFKGLSYKLFYYGITLLFLAFILIENMKSLAKKIVLGVLSLFSIYVVVRLMEYGIYFTLGTTLLQLLVIEEITEIFEPYYDKIISYYKLKHYESEHSADNSAATDPE